MQQVWDQHLCDSVDLDCYTRIEPRLPVALAAVLAHTCYAIALPHQLLAILPLLVYRLLHQQPWQAPLRNRPMRLGPQHAPGARLPVVQGWCCHISSPKSYISHLKSYISHLSSQQHTCYPLQLEDQPWCPTQHGWGGAAP